MLDTYLEDVPEINNMMTEQMLVNRLTMDMYHENAQLELTAEDDELMSIID
jgi:hypothetical protein